MSTPLAVLPVFESGGRLLGRSSANELLTPERAGGAVDGRPLRALRLLVGYPHLLSGLQGEALKELLARASDCLEAEPIREGLGAPLLAIDVNGATLGASADADAVLGPALPLADLLHANLDEACHIAGVDAGALDEASATEEELMERVAAPLLAAGVAVVAITLGPHGPLWQ